MYSILLLSELAWWIPCALAAPSHIRRAESNPSPTISSRLWVPILLVGLFLLLGTWLACRGKGLRYWLANWRSVAAPSGSVTNLPASGGDAATRELTAEDLTRNARRSTNTNSNRTSTTSGPAGRRARRARRTPSQISTKSLPAYNKDPGEHELVIYSGPPEEDETDEEDETLNSSMTAVMSIIEEQSGSSSSQDIIHARSMVSLLPRGADEDASTQGLRNLNPHSAAVRRSSETMIASDESSSALLPPGDPRGEAPPYETIDIDEEQREGNRMSSNAVVFPQQPSHTQTSSERNRLSGFLSYFIPRGSNHANPGPVADSNRSSTAHSRDRSGASFPVLTSVESHGSQRGGQPRRGHRSNASSGSGLSFAAFRTISRTRSNLGDGPDSPLTSPSLISLNSISAPLTHTAMRTEFTYPRSGPTPEQIKFISSRETFGRFGLPYGPDAVAFAASASRQDLVPPPDFDSLHPAASAANDSTTVEEAYVAASSRDVANNTAGSYTPSPISTLSSSEASDAPKSSPASNEPLPDVPTSLSTAPPPSSFRFDANQTLAPGMARSSSAASSYATFETAHDSVPTSPKGIPQIHVVQASNHPSLTSLHAIQPDIEENASDSGQPVPIHVMPIDKGKGQLVEDSDSSGEDESEEEEEDLRDENITTTTRHTHEGTSATLRSPAAPQAEAAPSPSLITHKTSPQQSDD